ncbi:hypothetical protein CQW23_24490 [Capsicum baccatum]|uniref:Uncharacterized protein n=1 Tax=Capsicum baccatum TaxID=33114 RepID=A0A2G2VUW8_CAPBA|nr:hypothetical protein CQW23_24490 [Capsicum baccatum]
MKQAVRFGPHAHVDVNLPAQVKGTGQSPASAEAPDAYKDKVTELLAYMLAIEGEDELRSFYSICFLLPMLCQVTLTTGGCKILASSGAFREVVGYLIALIEQNNYTSEDNVSIFLACDSILNHLLKWEQIKFPLDDPSFIRLLVALSHWAASSKKMSS